MRGVPTTDETRASAIRLRDFGCGVREVARRLGVSKSSVSRWYAKWREKQKTEKRRARRAKKGPVGYLVESATWNEVGERVEKIPRLTKEQRQHLTEFLGEDIDPGIADQVLDDTEQRILCFAGEGVERPYNFQQDLWRQLSTLHDAFYAGSETMGRQNTRRQMKVNFYFYAMKYAGCGMPAKLAERLKNGEMPTPGESRAVRKTSSNRSEASQNFGRAVTDGVLLLKDGIWDVLPRRAAAVGLSVERYLEDTDDGRRLGEIYSRHFFTPIDTAQKDPALSEECRRLGVRLN